MQPLNKRMCGEAIKLDSDMIGNILEGSRDILAVFFWFGY